MDDELHYPPGAEPEKPADAPAPEGDKAPEGEQPEPEKPEGEPKPGEETPAPEGDKPKDEQEPTPEAPLQKKRSIYDDLKDTRQEKNAWKDAAISALKAQGIELTGKETPEELQALAKETPAKEKPAPEAPKEPPKEPPADDLETFAKEQEIDPKSLERLTEIIAKRIPKAELSEQDKADLQELKMWREQRAREQEDMEIERSEPQVRTLTKELGFEIHDDAEAKTVMAEIKRLAHTKEFHDKPVDYIVFANRTALSKMVSPKKPSFEAGGQPGEAAPEKDIDFSSSKVTPMQAQKALESGSTSSYDIRRAS